MASNLGKDTFDSQRNAPLHRPAGSIDAGKASDDNQDPILKPDSGPNPTKPGPGGVVEGQVSKM